MSKRYVVRVERSGRWWAISVRGVRGAFGQTRRLDQWERMAREAVAGLLDVDPESFDLVLDLHLPTGIRSVIRAAERARSNAEDADERAAAETSRAATTLVGREGMSVRDAGELLGLSHQRIAQLVSQADRNSPQHANARAPSPPTRARAGRRRSVTRALVPARD